MTQGRRGRAVERPRRNAGAQGRGTRKARKEGTQGGRRKEGVAHEGRHEDGAVTG